MLYKCMVLPIFDYGDVFYNKSANKVLLDKLQTLQNSAIRIISKLKNRTNTNSEELELGLLHLDKRRLLHCIHAGAIIAKDTNQLDTFQNRNIRTRSTTDNRLQLIVFNPRKTVCERSYSYQVRRIWNSLPTEFHTAADKAALNRLFYLRADSSSLTLLP